METLYTKKELQALLKLQQGEMNGYEIYKRLSNRVKDEHNTAVLMTVALEERKHYDVFKSYTKKDIKHSKLVVFLFTTISTLFGLTFGVKLLERGEKKDIAKYNLLKEVIPDIEQIITDEEHHEQMLIKMLDEEGLTYMSSVVLGLNDALVELTGALAGFTLSIQHSRTIALLGLITGISASLSMAASEYLSTKTEEDQDNSVNALKASIYTGVAYIITVLLLVTPFLIFNQYILALGVSIGIAILIIAIFNFYISVAKDFSFKKRFFGMASVSIGVAIISFLIGYVVKTFIGVEL